MPGQLQAPRQQPDLAPEARGEARAAAGPDLPEAPGGRMEVGGRSSDHAARVSGGWCGAHGFRLLGSVG